MAQNEIVLVDTSVWIDHFNGILSKKTKLLHNLLEHEAEVVTCPPIIQELLQGIKDDNTYGFIKDYLIKSSILQIDFTQASIGAAELYRSLRKKGITIQKSFDCLIAYFAIYFNIPLLHNDKDFDLISKHSKLINYS